jgi:hypothetical protein
MAIEMRHPICYIIARKGDSDVQVKDPAPYDRREAGAGVTDQNMQEDKTV